MPKVVLLGASPWPLPRGLMRPTGTKLDVSDAEAQVLFERGLIDIEQELEGNAGSVGDSEIQESPEGAKEAEESPEPAAQYGKKYPALPKKTAGMNVWKEYARVNGIDLRGLTEKPEIMGHVAKVVGSQ